MGPEMEERGGPPGSDPVYVVVEDDEPGRFRVVDETGRTLVICPGRRNAEHYATLLAQAYARGYRAGSRAARAARE